MTQVTPPGWYPDPGQKSDGPATERWWDGGAWTEQTRPAGSAAPWGPPPAQPGYPGPVPQPGQPGFAAMPTQAAFPAHPGYPGQPGAAPAGRRRGLRTGIAVAVAAAVLASIGVGVYALTKADDGGSDRAGTQADRGAPDGRDGGPSGDGGGPDGPSPDPGESPGESPGDGPRGEAPEVEGGGTLRDPANAISLPVPEGWSGQAMPVGAQMTSETTYKCPSDPSQQCTKGGAYSAPAELLGAEGSTPEAVAKADIAANAKESYGQGYGKITSHRVLASKAVTVAGQKGYLVRWKAITSKGSDGYVQSLAFPSPADKGRLVLVRFGVDVDQPLSILDDITEGIEASSGGGDGQDV
ncbi:DUF2510 domain-containing protein [Streptomyces sp. NPDC053367]|uniref:DUF2510 domain-containing protein n=1 Tax=Streptomyces sp. NPDC053367 TaxID=3365700 RepID=UPI0037D52538